MTSTSLPDNPDRRIEPCSIRFLLSNLYRILTVFLPLFFCLPLHGDTISEQEPNDGIAQANECACGDTVFCAEASSLFDEDWFRFSSPEGRVLILETHSCSSETNTLLSLYDGDEQLLAADDNGGLENFSRIEYRANYTGGYFVRIMRFHTPDDGEYSLSIDCQTVEPQSFDLCDGARVMPPWYQEGNTAGMADNGGAPGPDVFYRFSITDTADIFIEVCAELFDARVQLFHGCDNPSDDGGEGCEEGEGLTVYGLLPGEYEVMVEGWTADDWGQFSIEVTNPCAECPPPEEVILRTVGGYPFLDWSELTCPDQYIVWYCSTPDGTYEHLGTTPFTFFVDSTGYTQTSRFYKVTSVCP